LSIFKFEKSLDPRERNSSF